MDLSMIRQQQSLINYSIQNAIILQNLQFQVGVWSHLKTSWKIVSEILQNVSNMKSNPYTSSYVKLRSYLIR